VITLEPDASSAKGIRASVSAVIFDRRGQLGVYSRRLPPTLLPNHRVRIRDARVRRARAFIR
jgi:hypothetical protein